MNRRKFIVDSLISISGISLPITPFILNYNKKLESIVSENSLDQYKRWIRETIEESREKKDYAIIIDKFNYSLDVYKSGKLIKKYNIELGFNPIDDKEVLGDGCTPEGKFYVAYKNPDSWFYKALLISYPNIGNAEIGLKLGLINRLEYNQIVNAIKNKDMPLQNTSLGGLVEIHGSGSGKKGNDGGYNWTLGCVAVSNKDIEELFNIVELRTPLTIVEYDAKNINSI